MDTCPSLTTGTAQIAVLSGRSDAGAWHRAVTIANRLIAAGRYDWRTQGGIEFFDVYAIDALDVEQLQEGVHYVLGRVAPHTDTERVHLQQHKAALEQQQRAAQKAEKAEGRVRIADVRGYLPDDPRIKHGIGHTTVRYGRVAVGYLDVSDLFETPTGRPDVRQWVAADGKVYTYDMGIEPGDPFTFHVG